MIFLKDGTCEFKDKYQLNTELNYPVLKQDGSNKNDFYSCGDNVRSFERNVGGYIRSDIAAIREQQDIAVANAMLSRLQEIPASDPNAGKSDSEILLSHRSKYCQTPSEMTRYIESQLDLRDSQVRASAPENSDTIKFEEGDSTVVDDKS